MIVTLSVPEVHKLRHLPRYYYWNCMLKHMKHV
nr:MAG TPA: hypothetical protein [Caudoviricetes sp.]